MSVARGALVALLVAAVATGGYLFLEAREDRIESDRVEIAYDRGFTVGSSIAAEFRRGERAYAACSSSVDEDEFNEEYGSEADYTAWETAYFEGCHAGAERVTKGGYDHRRAGRVLRWSEASGCSSGLLVRLAHKWACVRRFLEFSRQGVPPLVQAHRRANRFEHPVSLVRTPRWVIR